MFYLENTHIIALNKYMHRYFEHYIEIENKNESLFLQIKKLSDTIPNDLPTTLFYNVLKNNISAIEIGEFANKLWNKNKFTKAVELYNLMIDDESFNAIDFNIFSDNIKLFYTKHILMYITAIFDNNSDDINILERIFNILFHNHKSSADLITLCFNIADRIQKIDNQTNWNNPIQRLKYLTT